MVLILQLPHEFFCLCVLSRFWVDGLLQWRTADDRDLILRKKKNNNFKF